MNMKPTSSKNPRHQTSAENADRHCGPRMRRLISIVMTLCLIFTMVIPASAADFWREGNSIKYNPPSPTAQNVTRDGTIDNLGSTLSSNAIFIDYEAMAMENFPGILAYPRAVADTSDESGGYYSYNGVSTRDSDITMTVAVTNKNFILCRSVAEGTSPTTAAAGVDRTGIHYRPTFGKNMTALGGIFSTYLPVNAGATLKNGAPGENTGVIATITYSNAATLSNGEKANVVVTLSDAVVTNTLPSSGNNVGLDRYIYSGDSILPSAVPEGAYDPQDVDGRRVKGEITVNLKIQPNAGTTGSLENESFLFGIKDYDAPSGEYLTSTWYIDCFWNRGDVTWTDNKMIGRLIADGGGGTPPTIPAYLDEEGNPLLRRTEANGATSYCTLYQGVSRGVNNPPYDRYAVRIQEGGEMVPSITTNYSAFFQVPSADPNANGALVNATIYRYFSLPITDPDEKVYLYPATGNQNQKYYFTKYPGTPEFINAKAATDRVSTTAPSNVLDEDGNPIQAYGLYKTACYEANTGAFCFWLLSLDPITSESTIIDTNTSGLKSSILLTGDSLLECTAEDGGIALYPTALDYDANGGEDAADGTLNSGYIAEVDAATGITFKAQASGNAASSLVNNNRTFLEVVSNSGEGGTIYKVSGDGSALALAGDQGVGAEYTDTVAQGTALTYRMTPSEGYRLSTVTLRQGDEAQGVTIDMTNAVWTNNTYTYESGDVSHTFTKTDDGAVSYSFDGENGIQRNWSISATWSEIPTYTVTYDANGGSGAPEPQTKTHGVDLILSSTRPTKDSYTVTLDPNYEGAESTTLERTPVFSNWTSLMSQMTEDPIYYEPGDTYTDDQDMELAAVWQEPEAGNLPDPSSREGYTFDGWYTQAVGGNKVDAGDLVLEDTTYYAHWSAETYPVTYNANGGSGAPAEQTKTHGVALPLSSTRPTKAGYTLTLDPNYEGAEANTQERVPAFTKWTTAQDGSGESYQPGDSYTANAGVTLYAQWEEPAVGELPDLNRAGYSFDGWFTEATGGAQVDADTVVTGDTTYYAHWSANTYSVEFNDNGGSSAPEAQTKTHDVELTLTSERPTKDSYTVRLEPNYNEADPLSPVTRTPVFQSWNTDREGNGDSYQPGAAYTANAAVTLYAQWQEPAAGELPDLTREDAVFNGWFTEATGGDKVDADTPVTGDTTYYAHWTAVTYSVEYDANGGSGAPSGQTKVHGINLPLSDTRPTRDSYTVTLDPNYTGGETSTVEATPTFNEWNTAQNGDGESYQPGDSYTANAEVTLYAQWEEPALGVLPDLERAGYTFDGWFTEAAGGTQVDADTVVTGDTTYYAHWTVNTYSVEFNDNGGSSAPDAQTKTHDVELTLTSERPTKDSYTLTLDPNYTGAQTSTKDLAPTFTEWNTDREGKGESYQPGGSYTANAEVTLYAQWQDPAAGELPTPTRDGYTFDGWFTDPNGDTPPVDANTVVIGDTTYYAHWTEIPRFTVTYDPNDGENAPEPQVKTGGVDLPLATEEPSKSFEVTLDPNYTGAELILRSADAVFNGWNTEQDGSGQSYAPGATYTGDADLVLYAQWTNPAVGDLPEQTRDGYTFDGWFTDPVGGSQVDANTVVDRTTTYYGHWTEIPSFTVTYLPNGGTNAPDPQTKTGGIDLPLTDSKPTKTYELVLNPNHGDNVITMSQEIEVPFVGWNTEQDGSGTSYAPGAAYKADADLTLYAQWEDPAVGPLSPSSRDGYSFDGWYTAPEGGEPVDENTVISGDTTFYAHWTEDTDLYIVTQPQSVTVPAGETAIIPMKANGVGLTYQWYLQNSNQTRFFMSSITEPVYTVDTTKKMDGRQLYCVVTDVNGDTVQTETVILSVEESTIPLDIETQPQDVTVVVGEVATTAVEATGSGLTYQWYLKNADQTKFNKSSVTGPEYDVTATAEMDGRQLYCVITDANGRSVTSDTVTLHVTLPDTDLAIVTQPTDIEVAVGETASTTVVASGDGLSYQWYTRNSNQTRFYKSSVTDPTYSVSATEKMNGRQLYCVIKDAAGNRVQSETITLHVSGNQASTDSTKQTWGVLHG